ncbi:MAG: alpha/beta hydrolase [Spongiibacteraceae bacterium]
MFFVDNNGVRLHCVTLGNGPAIVLCHGLVFGSMASWYFSIAAKLAQRYRVILFDKRGHGKSDMTSAGYDIDTLASDLAAVIEHTVPRGEDVTLIGHSYGALVALRYALNRKRRVRDLILVDAPLPASRYVFPSFAKITSREGLETHLSALLPPNLSTSSRRIGRIKERLETLLLNSSLRADVASAGDIIDAELRRLDTPTLCIYGRQSDCAEVGLRLKKILPRAKLEWIECGHYILEEAPQELLGVIESYLDSQEGQEWPVVERRQLVANGSLVIERRLTR